MMYFIFYFTHHPVPLISNPKLYLKINMASVELEFPSQHKLLKIIIDFRFSFIYYRLFIL